MAVKATLRPPQVFINFRGAELRDNFVNHLVRALREGEINVFIDVHELKGRKLRHLFTRIKKSKIALAIFSKRYCESKWCLDELVKMNDQMKEGTLVVIPIFYNVTANDVKRAGNLDRETDFHGEEEDFTILFKEMKKKYAIDRVKRWELSLKSVTERMGLSTEVYGNFLVKSIVREVRRHLGMPLEKPLSDGDVAFTALWVSSVFSFFIAPLFFTDVKFFKTGEWVLGFPLLVLSWRVWVRENQDEPLAFIRQPYDHTIVWDKENQYKPQVLTSICENRNKPFVGLIRKRNHCSICGMENRNKSPAFTIRQQHQSCIWDGENKKKPVFFIRHSRHCSICERENQNKPLIIIRKPHPSKTRIRSKET